MYCVLLMECCGGGAGGRTQAELGQHGRVRLDPAVPIALVLGRHPAAAAAAAAAAGCGADHASACP